MKNEVTDLTTVLPDSFPLRIVMEKRPAQVSQWVDYVWTAIGVTVGDNQQQFDTQQLDTQQRDTQQLDTGTDISAITHLENDVEVHIYSGFKIKLYIDECDSYYRNLMSDTPHCYVVVRADDDADIPPRPFLVSLSFDEAHAYLEGGDTVFVVDIPPELYRWSEAFVLNHYCPEQLQKRKRRNWKDKKPAGHSPESHSLEGNSPKSHSV